MNWPLSLTEIKHEQTDGKKKGAKKGKSGAEVMPKLRRDRKITKASSELQRTINGRNPLPEMPCGSGPTGRPQTQGCGTQVPDLQANISADENKAGRDLRDAVFRGDGTDRCEQAMGGQDHAKEVPVLPGDVHIQTSTGNDVQPVLREQTGMGESWWSVEPDIGRVAQGVKERVNRLKALGNGQVPLQAAVAFKILMGEAS